MPGTTHRAPKLLALVQVCSAREHGTNVAEEVTGKGMGQTYMCLCQYVKCVYAHTHTHIFLQPLPCFQRNVGQEACGVAVLSERSEQTGMAKSNIITATSELVKEQKKGDVPEGETPPAYNWGHLNFSLGETGLQAV